MFRSGVFFVNINGTDISTFSNAGSLHNSTNPFYIGRSSFSSRYLDGRIAAVIDKARFDSEYSGEEWDALDTVIENELLKVITINSLSGITTILTPIILIILGMIIFRYKIKYSN